MAEGRERAEWDRAALLAALLCEPHRDAKRRRQPYTTLDFHPYERLDAGLDRDDGPADEIDWRSPEGRALMKRMFTE